MWKCCNFYFSVSFCALRLLGVFPCLLHVQCALPTKHFWTWLHGFGCPSSVAHLLLLLPFWLFPAPIIRLLPPVCFAAVLHSQLLPLAEISTVCGTCRFGRQNHWLQELAIWFWLLGDGNGTSQSFWLNGFPKFTSPERYQEASNHRSLESYLFLQCCVVDLLPVCPLQC